jgi:protease-4
MSESHQRPLDARVLDGAAEAQGTGGKQPPVVVIQQPAPGGRGRGLWWLGWLGLAICLPLLLGVLANRQSYQNADEGLNERFVSGDLSAADKIAIIEITGLIGDGDGEVKKQINRVRKDDSVKAVVVRINSPGGTVTGSDFIHHHLTRLREERQLPLVVSMGGIAASGGYYIAMAVGDQDNAIFAEPTTTTGSIGVIIPHYDVSGLLERYDIKEDSLVSHPRKKLLSVTTAMSEDHRQVLGRYLDQAFDRFKEIVKGGRPKFRADESALDRVATGEIFAAPVAKDLGLVDQIGFVEEAVVRAAELAGLHHEKVRVVRYESPLNLMRALGLTVRQHQPDESRWQMLLEMATPRAYYLFTALPLAPAQN